MRSNSQHVLIHRNLGLDSSALPAFTGPISQMPPAYSALKVDGRRAYDRARAGEEVTLATRSVVIHSLTLMGASLDHATFCARFLQQRAAPSRTRSCRPGRARRVHVARDDGTLPRS